MRKNAGRLKIKTLYLAFTVVLAAMSILLLYGSHEAEQSIREVQGITEKYIEEENAISQLRETSDYLTEKSRAFVVTGDIDALYDYQLEVVRDQRRDKALQVIRENEEDSEVYQELERALEESNNLADVEYYAMRLAAEGYGIQSSQLTNELRAVELTEEDKNLPPEEKIKRATTMLFDENYENIKSSITERAMNSFSELVASTRAQQLASYEKAVRFAKREHMLLVALLLLIFLMMGITAVTIIIPVSRSAGYIQRNEALPVHGAAEYAFLAQTYNRMRDKTNKHNERLSYAATHDELTRLYNRKYYEEKRAELADSDVAMLLIDIDHFKEINDTYGHDVGDRVLKEVADVLSSVFRLGDCVCRVGGDEFVVMMMQMQPELKHVVESKIRLTRSRLNSDPTLPNVTLSIGVAFTGDTGEEADLFKRADLALYNTKNKGRNGYSFYSDLTDSETVTENVTENADM